MTDSPMPGWERIREERERQIRAEGWTPEHDDEHARMELSRAAAAYMFAAVTGSSYIAPSTWPWDHSWWKPSDDPVRNLVKAGALIAAEIDRLTRANLSAGEVPGSDDRLER